MFSFSLWQTILFTKDPQILESILVNDKNFQALLKDNEPLIDPSTIEKRPPTANDNKSSLSPSRCEELDDLEPDVKYVVKQIKLTLMSNWGGKHLIGLTGLWFLIIFTAIVYISLLFNLLPTSKIKKYLIRLYFFYAVSLLIMVLKLV